MRDLLHTNNINYIKLSERHGEWLNTSLHTSYHSKSSARDLCRLRDAERTMRVYVDSTYFGCYRRHAHPFRHAEYYQLVKWIEQIQRYMASAEPKEAIAVLIRVCKSLEVKTRRRRRLQEMNERARLFKLDPEDQEQYRELARLPHIYVPVGRFSKYEEQV